ncbi:MAG: 1-acyl-sn-glycerol-3-phosphate acyltransferase [Sulfurospirillum sp.]|nr:1-acyl-sn-glycerol-3-phosphate acyltransferase [Sulfurospirillum sp.]
MLAKIRGYFIIIEFSLTILIVILLLYLFKNKKHKIRKLYGTIQSYFMGFNVIQKGEPDKEAKLILINHQSLIDIIALEATYPKDLCWVAKKEIEQIPIFGHVMTVSQMISIDRKNKRSIIEIIKLSKKRLSEGRVIAMFPEGTRGDGKNLLEFQVGAKILAEKLNLKVQPVVIANTKHVFNSEDTTSNRDNISVMYLNSIDPKSDKNWFETMKNNMQIRLKDELANYNSHR